MSLYEENMLKLWTRLLKAETKNKTKKAAKLERKIITGELALKAQKT